MNNYSEFGESPVKENTERNSLWSETEIGWLAGIIDGEGSIGIAYGKNHVPFWRVTIANSCPILLSKYQDILFKMFGVTLKWHEKKQRSDGGVRYTKPAYTISMCKKAHVEKLLLTVLPYLTTKHSKATECLAWLVQHPSRVRVDTERVALGLKPQDGATVRANR